MEKAIISIINDILVEKKQNQRIKYIPYSEKIAKHVWFGIAKSLIQDNIEITDDIKNTWTELIKYTHADDSCVYDLNKSILLMGMTGSGKSVTMDILSKYAEVDNVKFIRNGKEVSFIFKLINSRQIVDDYAKHGYDGIAKYTIFSNICIDDLGSEPDFGNHYGNKLDVLSEIIEKRYEKSLTTHFTTNLNDDLIREKYNDRVYSRIKQTCSFIKLNDKDFRIK